MENVIIKNSSDCPKCKSPKSFAYFQSGKRGICSVCGYRQRKRGRQHKIDSLINDYTKDFEYSFWAKRIDKNVKEDFSLLARLQFDLRTDRHSRVVYFPYIRRSGKISEIRKIIFNDDGYIIRSFYPIYMFKCKNLSLFNEYRLFNPNYQIKENNPVILLESETKCVQSSILYPQFTWIAVGFLNPLSLENANTIKDSGKDIVLSFENNAVSKEKEKEAQEILTEIGVKANIIEFDYESMM
jgi:hypothetical protein